MYLASPRRSSAARKFGQPDQRHPGYHRVRHPRKRTCQHSGEASSVGAATRIASRSDTAVLGRITIAGPNGTRGGQFRLRIGKPLHHVSQVPPESASNQWPNAPRRTRSQRWAVSPPAAAKPKPGQKSVGAPIWPTLHPSAGLRNSLRQSQERRLFRTGATFS